MALTPAHRGIWLDAVAGVVNLILDNKYVGFKPTSNMARPPIGDQSEL